MNWTIFLADLGFVRVFLRLVLFATIIFIYYSLHRTLNDPIPDKVLREVKSAEEQIALLNDILAQLGGPNSNSAKNNDMVKEMVKK